MRASVVANFLIYIMSLTFDDQTNGKLNLLLYFAQGHSLQMDRKPLFTDEIEAWSLGPIVPAVYTECKAYGDSPITTYDMDLVGLIPKDAENLLLDIARTYGQYTESTLRNMTKVIGAPWSQVYTGQIPHSVIPVGIMEQYFLDLQPLKPVESAFQESDSAGHWDDEGALVLPKAWDDSEVAL